MALPETTEQTDTLLESNTPRGLKVLFLSSDTGGGHRASAESLAKQFQILCTLNVECFVLALYEPF
jgi:hypothetical protein